MIKDLLLKYRKIDLITNCWLWTARLNNNGYGVISLQLEGDKRHKDYLVHRLSFIEFKFPLINNALHIQECLNKNCFNPDHLYNGTKFDNVIDEIEKGTHANQYGLTNKTHCQNGHLLEGSNVINTTHKTRRCRICRDNYNNNNPNKKKYQENRRKRHKEFLAKLKKAKNE